MKTRSKTKKIAEISVIDDYRVQKCYVDKQLKIKIHVFNGTERICQCKELSSVKEEKPGGKSGWGRASAEYKKVGLERAAKKKAQSES